jgi:hypothetical protein
MSAISFACGLIFMATTGFSFTTFEFAFGDNVPIFTITSAEPIAHCLFGVRVTRKGIDSPSIEDLTDNGNSLDVFGSWLTKFRKNAKIEFRHCMSP